MRHNTFVIKGILSHYENEVKIVLVCDEILVHQFGQQEETAHPEQQNRYPVAQSGRE